MDYLGKKSVDSYEAQDHGCTDEAVALLWSSSQNSPLAKQVSIKVPFYVIQLTRPVNEPRLEVWL